MNPNDTLDHLFTPEAFRQTMSGTVASARAGMPVAGDMAASEEMAPEQQDLGPLGYAGDILGAIPKGIVGAARDVASLAYLPAQSAFDLPEIPDYFGMFSPSQTMAGTVVENLATFVTGYGAVARGLGWAGRATTIGMRAAKAARAAEVAAVAAGGAKGARLARAGVEFARTSTISGVASGLVFDGNEERLSNLLRNELGFTDPVTEYLAADENDTEIEGRLKNVIEDFLLGGVAEIGIQSVKAAARLGTNQMRVHRAGVKAKLAGLDPDEAIAKEMAVISEEQAVSLSRAMDLTLDESNRVLKVIDATGAARENFSFMTRSETREYLSRPDVQENLAKQGMTPEGIAAEAKGFATMNDAGKVIVGAFTGADLGTALHEVAHGIRMLVVDPSVANRVLSQSDIGIIAEAAGAVRNADGTISWGRDSEEAFVSLFERYLREGVSPSRQARGVFTKLTGWVREMYGASKAEVEAGMNPELKFAFDNLFSNGIDGTLNKAGRIVPKGEILLQSRAGRQFDAKSNLPKTGKGKELAGILSDEEFASIKSKRGLETLIDVYKSLNKTVRPLFKALAEAGAASQGGYQEGAALLRRLMGNTRTELYAMFSAATSPQNRVSNHTKLGIGITADLIDRIRGNNLADITTAEMEKIVSDAGSRLNAKGMVSGYAEASMRVANDILARVRQARQANPEASIDEIVDNLDTSGLFKNLRGGGMEFGAGKTPSYAESAAGRMGMTALDTYMVRVLPDNLFPGKSGEALIEAKKAWIAKAPNYNAMAAVIRSLSSEMGSMPGQIQERIWTSIFASVALKRMGVSYKNVLKNLTDDDIIASWDLLTVLQKPEVTNELRRLGVDEGSIADLPRIAGDVRKEVRTLAGGPAGVTDPGAFEEAARRISGAGGQEVISARAARGTLLKAEFDDFTPKKVKDITKRDDWAVVTAENPSNQTIDAETNARNNARLEQELIDKGIPYRKVTGRYGKDPENSFIILADADTALDISRRYGQESFLNREGLVYRDGSVNPARKVNVLDKKTADYYTEYEGGKFSLDIDFDTKTQSQLLRDRPAVAAQPILLQSRQVQLEPGSPGLGTPAGRGGEPVTQINFARFSTVQAANEHAKEVLESLIERTVDQAPVSIEQQVARAQPALRELSDALGVSGFDNIEQFLGSPSVSAGAVRDAGNRILAARQMLADVGNRVANIAKKHRQVGHAEMYEFLRGQQAMKFLAHYVKTEVREVARVLGAQRAVFVPDPDFKILPGYEPKAVAQVPPQAAPSPAAAMPEAGARMPQEATQAGAVPGIPPAAAATPEAALAAPAPSGAVQLDPEAIAKIQAQVIQDAGGEQAIRAQMHRIAMAQASGNPLAVAKMSRAGRFGNVLTEYFMNSILSSPATQFVNIMGNSLVSMYLPLERAMGASIRGLAGGQGVANSFRMAMDHMKPYRHMFHVFNDSLSLAGSAIKADRNILENIGTVELRERAISAKGLGMAEGTTAAKAVNWLGTVLNIPTRVLSGTDEMFKQLNYRAALMTELEMEGMARFNGDAMQASQWAKQTFDRMVEGGQAYAEKNVVQKAMVKADEAVANGTIKADERSNFIARFMADTNNWDPELGALSERAMDYSRYATFSTPLVVGEGGRISRVSARIQQLAEESTAIRFIMPFIRTPTRILEFALDRSIPGQASNLKKAFGDLRAKLDHPQRAVRDEAMGRVAFAVMTTYGMFHMINAGLVTGDGPSNPTEREAWLQAGNQPYSIRFGDSWVSYRRLDPFASMMGLIVDTVDSYGRATERQRPQLESVMNSIIIGLANNFTNKSYLTGVTAVLEAIKDPERYGDKLINQYVSAAVPFSSALRSAKSSVTDDLVVRDIRGMKDAIMNTIPGASAAVEPRRNMFGEPVERAEALGPDWLSPITYTKVKDDMIMQELDLIGHSFDAPRESRNGMDLTQIVTPSGQTAYDRWQELHGQVKISGRTLRQELMKLIKSRDYQAMSPETTDMYESPRVRAMRSVVEKYRAAAYRQLMKESPDVRNGVNRDFAVKRALKTGRPVDELMALTNR